MKSIIFPALIIGSANAGFLWNRQASTITASSASSASSTIPDYFVTSPEAFAGPTTTGNIAPFLAQTNVYPTGTGSFIPNTPLETAIPIANNPSNGNIYQLQGQLSSYFPNPDGFNQSEYPLPPGANITQLQVLHRHGARYPTGGQAVYTLGAKLYNATKNGTANFTGPLSFINTWQFQLGSEILVARGRQEMFDSGVLFYYNYGGMYNTSTKIVARTPSQDRMIKSAEYFMAGFFGFEWPRNVSLEVVIEQSGYNNSMAGYYQCNNSNSYVSTGGTNASTTWQNIYLQNATQRFNSYSTGYNWSVSDVYAAQTLCPYETVAFGYSKWCNLFTFPEWQAFEYSIDLSFQGNNGFLSPTGRGVGIGWVEEFYARLQGHLYNLPPGSTNVNTTLDTMNSTFPLNQSLYFDFSHDTNIYSVITAFGLTQFNDSLPATYIPASRNVIISHICPFGARMVWEVIRTPQPLKATRPMNATSMSDYYNSGNTTTYLHLMINQRTVPLGKSWAACGNRTDGWCEMSAAMSVLSGLLNTARYQYSCFANYPAVPYGNLTNGTAITKRDVLDLSFHKLGRGMGSGLEFKEDMARYL